MTEQLTQKEVTEAVGALYLQLVASQKQIAEDNRKIAELTQLAEALKKNE